MNRTPKRAIRPRRTMVRCLILVVAILALLPAVSRPEAMAVVPGASPLVAGAVALATRVLVPGAIVAVVFLAVSFVRRRWFCRWICPMGLMNECAGKASRAKTSPAKRVPRVGVGLALLTLSAAAVGYPLVLWLDPLAIFSAAAGVLVDPTNEASRAAAVVLVAIAVLSFLAPGIWCLRICPLGGMQDVLTWLRLGLVRIASRRSDTAKARPEFLANRRRWLAGAAAAACAALGAPLAMAVRGRAATACDANLRPPGSRPLWQFAQLCLRCGNCRRACPSGVITTTWQSTTWSTWLTPTISYAADYCREDCLRCIQSCPSGALSLPHPQSDKPALGVALVDMERCLLALGRECQTMCLSACPYEAITLHEWTWEDDRRYPIIVADRCPGCGACQVACTPMDAVVVVPLPSERTDSVSTS